MEVILKEDVDTLGHRGDVVKVADGYGRNFLLPKKLAIEATAANRNVIEQMKLVGPPRAKEKSEAEELAQQLERSHATSRARWARTITCSARSPRRTSPRELEQKGYAIDRRKVQLDEPLKTVGEFPVVIRIFREVTGTIKVQVGKEAAE